MRLTKARLDLLQAVADGAVTRYYPLGMVAGEDSWDRGPGTTGHRFRRVSARVELLQRDGLVKLLPADKPDYKASRRWDITPAGRMFLEANGGTP
ncbi:MAG TPA: hypothetical protein VNC22_21580 [Sporichthya sp.]|nr:hypothetical protein [Sporichthya sp.]